GVPGLKIRHNNVIGYHVEVTPAHAEKLAAAGSLFIHRQTLAGAVRFTTTDLAELESRIAAAAERALARELALFEGLVGRVLAAAPAIARAAAALAAIDVAAGLADLAAARGWTRPAIAGDRRFTITGGRHPVVEAALAASGERFVANDCDLGPDS